MEILNFLDRNILDIGAGLIILMLTNIMLGTGMAIVDDNKIFDKKKLIKGIQKAGLVIISFGLIYICGILNTDVIKIEFNGQSVNLIDGINMILTVGAGIYGAKVFNKLSEIVISKQGKE